MLPLSVRKEWSYRTASLQTFFNRPDMIRYRITRCLLVGYYKDKRIRKYDGWSIIDKEVFIRERYRVKYNYATLIGKKRMVLRGYRPSRHSSSLTFYYPYMAKNVFLRKNYYLIIKHLTQLLLYTTRQSLLRPY